MKKINVKTNSNSYLLRVSINGVSFSKTWGTVGDEDDYDYMRLVARKAAREIKDGTFTGFDKWFKNCEVWDRQKILESLKKLPSDQTSNALMKHLKRYSGQLSTPRQVDAFMQWLGVAEPTKARYLCVIRKVAPTVATGLSYAQSKGRPDPFQPNEVSKMLTLASCDTSFVINVWIDLGLRTGELAALQPNWIDWENKTIQIRGSWSRKLRAVKVCKSGHNRIIPFSDETYRILETNKHKEYPFQIFQQDSNFINRHWKPLLKKAEVRYRKPYCLRHTCASEKIVRYKGDLARVAYEMGHRIDTLAEHYAGVIHTLR